MKKVLSTVILVIMMLTLSACVEVDDTTDSSQTIVTSGSMVGTVDGDDYIWTTTEVTTTGSTGTVVENTAVVERKDDSIVITINGVKEAFVDEMSLSFEFPIDAVTTGTLRSTNLASNVDGTLAMSYFFNNNEGFDVLITKVVDYGTYIHVEGSITNVYTQDTHDTLYNISLEFNVDASERTLNGDPV